MFTLLRVYETAPMFFKELHLSRNWLQNLLFPSKQFTCWCSVVAVAYARALMVYNYHCVGDVFYPFGYVSCVALPRPRSSPFVG